MGIEYNSMPSTNVVCLYSIEENANLINELKRYFDTKKGYSVIVNTSVTIEDLATLPRCSVFFFATHGGHTDDRDGNWNFFMETDENSSPENIVRYQSLLDSNKIIVTSSDKFAITEKFINWQFENNSFVFFQSCYSLNEKCKKFRNIIKDCNASVYGGWTWGSTGSDSDIAVRYLFDRLLGANLFEEGYKMDPPQRPFNWQAVQKTMQGKLDTTWDRHNNCSSKMLIETSGKGDFGLLAPSIRNLEIDEKESTLTLHGLFGSDQFKMKAVIKEEQTGDISQDNYELTIDSSTNSQTIFCKNLPKSGKGSSGYLVIAVDYGSEKQVQSNPVPITSWDGTFAYKIMKPGGGTDSEIGKITYKAFLRGDIHKFRESPEEPVKPHYCVIGMVQDTNNQAQYTCGGTYEKNNLKYLWSGSGKLPPGDAQRGGGSVGIYGWYQIPQDPDHPKLFVLMFTGENEAKVSIYDKAGKTIIENLMNSISTAHLGNEVNTHPFILDFLQSSVIWDKTFDIPEKTLNRPIIYPPIDGKIFTAELKWEKMRAKYPPDSETSG